MAKIAFCHPGMIGDALYVLPSMRYHYTLTGEPADFWTSSYCSPLKTLFEYQPWVSEFRILEGYQVKGNGPGFQPWKMDIPDEYEKVFQCGFDRNPTIPLKDHISLASVGQASLPVHYEFPLSQDSSFKGTGQRIVVAPRGKTTYSELFREVIENEEWDIVQVGAPGDEIGTRGVLTGHDFLETLSIMYQADVFLGLMSSNLVLANGLPFLLKISPHDGRSWDMRHVIYSDSNKYPVNPNIEDIRRIINEFVQQGTRAI